MNAKQRHQARRRQARAIAYMEANPGIYRYQPGETSDDAFWVGKRKHDWTMSRRNKEIRRDAERKIPVARPPAPSVVFYGWYSESASALVGTLLYRNRQGRTVEVTSVSQDPKKSGTFWPDTKFVGRLYGRSRQGRPGIKLPYQNLKNPKGKGLTGTPFFNTDFQFEEEFDRGTLLRELREETSFFPREKVLAFSETISGRMPREYDFYPHHHLPKIPQHPILIHFDKDRLPRDLEPEPGPFPLSDDILLMLSDPSTFIKKDAPG